MASRLTQARRAFQMVAAKEAGLLARLREVRADLSVARALYIAEQRLAAQDPSSSDSSSDSSSEDEGEKTLAPEEEEEGVANKEEETKYKEGDCLLYTSDAADE